MFLPSITLRLTTCNALARAVRDLATKRERACHASVDHGVLLVQFGTSKVAVAVGAIPPGENAGHGLNNADDLLDALHAEPEFVRRDAGGDERAREGLSIAFEGAWTLRLAMLGHRVEPAAVALNH